MSYELSVIFSMSIGIGAVIGWVKIKKIDPAYFPYLLWLGLSFLNEIYSYIITEEGYSNVVSYNIFLIIEATLILWQFKKWQLFKTINRYYFLQSIFLTGWIAEVIGRSGLHQFNSYFIIGESTLIVFMSISMLNKVMFKESSALFMNPIFLICMGMIVYFTYSILIEVFWLYGLNKSKQFRIKIYEILAYINLITNLVYGIATIWIPLKPRYILRY